jgi:hypothetical protein
MAQLSRLTFHEGDTGFEGTIAGPPSTGKLNSVLSCRTAFALISVSPGLSRSASSTSDRAEFVLLAFGVDLGPDPMCLGALRVVGEDLGDHLLSLFEVAGGGGFVNLVHGGFGGGRYSPQ